MKIIVTGSLGNISKPLTEQLLANGHRVTVISSNPEKKNEIENLGASADIGSLSDINFLTETFKGADAVYCMIPPNFNTPDPIAHYQVIGNAYAKALQQAGIKKVVCLSSWGAHLAKGTGFIVGSYLVEQILNALTDVTITYLRPASFYYNLYHYMDMIKEAGMIGTNYGGEDKLVMVSPKDIADAAAEELEAKTTGTKIRYIASDEHTCNEIATVLGKAIGKPDLKWLKFPAEQVQSAMEKSGMPSHIASKLVELNASLESGLIREDYDLHKPTMAKVKLEDFAKEFTSVFLK